MHKEWMPDTPDYKIEGALGHDKPYGR